MNATHLIAASAVCATSLSYSQIPTEVPLPGGLSPSDVCQLTGVPQNDGQYTPFTKTHRMLLYLRCEATFQLFPGVPLKQGQQCCAHLTPSDGQGFFCPDTAAGGVVKAYVHSPLFPC
jgi:hypothetical protein